MDTTLTFSMRCFLQNSRLCLAEEISIQIIQEMLDSTKSSTRIYPSTMQVCDSNWIRMDAGHLTPAFLVFSRYFFLGKRCSYDKGMYRCFVQDRRYMQEKKVGVFACISHVCDHIFVISSRRVEWSNPSTNPFRLRLDL